MIASRLHSGLHKETASAAAAVGSNCDTTLGVIKQELLTAFLLGTDVCAQIAFLSGTDVCVQIAFLRILANKPHPANPEQTPR